MFVVVKCCSTFVKTNDNEKRENMTAYEKITAKLEAEKATILNECTYAKYVETIRLAKEKKDNYSFLSSSGGRIVLLDSDLFGFTEDNITLEEIEHFELMFELKFGWGITNQSCLDVIEALRYVLINRGVGRNYGNGIAIYNNIEI
jgi:hypothetical protein